MPLIINTESCKGQDPALNKAMAFAMMDAGIQALKDETDVKELFVRYRMLHLAANTLHTDLLLTLDQMLTFIGAHTNVSKKTPTQFGKDVAQVARESALSIMRRQVNEHV